jgi:hypothetical protein
MGWGLEGETDNVRRLGLEIGIIAGHVMAARKGCSPALLQTRATRMWLTPSAAASLRELEWVSSSGGLNGISGRAACRILERDALQRISFLAPHFEKRKLIGCGQAWSPSFLRILAKARTANQTALQGDFLAKCWKACMTYPGYPAFVRLVLFLQLLGLHLRNRLTVLAADK